MCVSTNRCVCWYVCTRAKRKEKGKKEKEKKWERDSKGKKRVERRGTKEERKRRVRMHTLMFFT
jgi:hypothetical protein